MSPDQGAAGSRLLRGVIAASLAGAVVSAYLLGFKFSSANLVCLTGQGCATVNASPYSKLFGIPVAALGLGAYLVLAALAYAWLRAGATVSEWVPLAILGLVVAGWLFSAYLTWIEAAVLHEYCSWCLVSAALMTVNLALVSLALAGRQ